MKLKKLFITASLSAATLGTFAGCSNNGNGYVYNKDYTTGYTTEIEAEKIVLDEVTSTGTEIYTFDIKNIDTAKKSNKNYLALSGELISEIENGRQKGTVVYSISDQNFSLAQEIQPVSYDAVYGGGSTVVDTTYANNNWAYQLYTPNGINMLKQILQDETSTVYTVKNLDTNELLYSAEKQKEQELSM